MSRPCLPSNTHIKQVIREFYRNTVVQVGFDCDFIMRGVLALSGLHLAHHRQPMRDHYLAAAITHHQAASQATIPLVLGATPENAQVLFLFSVLTTYYGACIFVSSFPRICFTHHTPFLCFLSTHPQLDETILQSTSAYTSNMVGS